MSPPDRGTCDWFAHKKRSIVRHARAADSFVAAERSVLRLLNSWETLDDELKSGLFFSAVVGYAVPFLHKPEYPSKHLAKHMGFQKKLHAHLLQLRNKLIAHADEDYAQGSVNQISANIAVPDGQTTVHLMIHVRVISLHSISSAELVKEHAAHIAATREGAWRALIDTMEDFSRASNEFVENYKQWVGTSKEAPIKGPHLKVSSGKEEAIDVAEILQSAPLKAPPLTVGQDSYLYRNFDATHRPQEQKVNLPGGVTLEISSKPTGS